MDSPTPVSEILSKKGSDVLSGAQDLTLVEAARLMVEASVGSLVIVDEANRIIGILTERDVLRFTARDPDRLEGTRVGDIMNRDVIVGLPTDTVDVMMAVMTDRRIRHLPILMNGQLAGIVSIGDLVKFMVHEATIEVRMLRDYITGSYPR